MRGFHMGSSPPVYILFLCDISRQYRLKVAWHFWSLLQCTTGAVILRLMILFLALFCNIIDMIDSVGYLFTIAAIVISRRHNTREKVFYSYEAFYGRLPSYRRRSENTHARVGCHACLRGAVFIGPGRELARIRDMRRALT